MKTIQRLQIEAATAVFDQFGLSWRIHNGGKHLAISVTAPDGAEHRVVVSGSPRNNDVAVRVKRSDAFKLVEKMGISTGRGDAPPEAQKGPRRRTRYKSTIHRVEVALEPDDGPGRDPWAVLRNRLP